MKYVQRHLSFGWWSLLLFLVVGIGLEALHGFKVAWYLNVGMETRRLMWRLAHAHGAFLGVIHIALAATIFVRAMQTPPTNDDADVAPKRRDKKRARESGGKTETNAMPMQWCQWASNGLIGASIAVPGGFFLGGLVIRGGDPGLGVLVLPVGAVLLLVAVALTAAGVSRAA